MGRDVNTDDPKVIGKALTEFTEDVKKFGAFTLFGKLTAPVEADGTPRKSGFASACWILSVGKPSTDLGGTKTAVSTGPQQRGLVEVSSYKLSMGEIFCSNNCDYIHVLNYRGPNPGFVERAYSMTMNELEKRFP